jgi:large exoprotein involved in heme utilization and adhesion
MTLKPEVDKPSTPAVSTSPTSSAPAQLVEAQGWVINTNGHVVLTAKAPTVTPHSSGRKQLIAEAQLTAEH